MMNSKLYFNHSDVGQTVGDCQGPAGSTVKEGFYWVNADGCNICSCKSYGTERQMSNVETMHKRKYVNIAITR